MVLMKDRCEQFKKMRASQICKNMLVFFFLLGKKIVDTCFEKLLQFLVIIY